MDRLVRAQAGLTDCLASKNNLLTYAIQENSHTLICSYANICYIFKSVYPIEKAVMKPCIISYGNSVTYIDRVRLK